MDDRRFSIISEALYTYGASDLNEQLLKTISLEELVFLCASTRDSRTSFRAAWALEHILIKNRDLLQQTTKKLIESYFTITNWSVLRSLTKLIIEITNESRQHSHSLSEEEEEKLLAKTFNILSDIDCPIAVRCNAYDIIFALIPQHEWLANELRIQIKFDLEKNTTPALLSRGLRILKKLGN